MPNSKRFITTETAKSVVEAVRNFGERNSRIDIPLVECSNGTSNSTPVATLIKKSHALQNACRSPLVVGVFQNTEVEVLTSIIDEVGLDLVQLHGEEGMEVYAKCTVPAIRVIHVDSSTDDHRSDLAKTVVSSLTTDPIAILLDTSVKGAKGGTGVTFDWALAKEIQNIGLPVIVAGGLNAENVEELVVKVGPWGVDVSSGVEESPGKKDTNKVVAFISNAKNAAEQASKMF